MTDYTHIILTRSPSTPQGTFGVLSANGIPLCVTCELPWLNNQPNISCIPVGVYNCQRGPSPSFPEGNTWAIEDVEDRTGVRLHNANDIAQLEGCVAVGDSFGTLNNLPAVLNSVQTLAMLNKILPDNFTLTIQ